VHEYHSSLAPSRQLIREHQSGSVSWPAFSGRYRKELLTEKSQEELVRLASIARKEVITLLCFCAEERGCHRTLLREAIIEAGD
jgi:uncharacterized protein YeaO (DUF488 family)